MSKNIYQRNGIWWARFKVAGTEYRESLRTRSERKANTLAERRIEQVRNEVYFGDKGPSSWQAAIVSWHQNATADLGDKTVLRYAASLKQVRPWLDDKLVHMIDVDVLREMVKGRRKQGATTATIRRDLTAISSVMEHAIEEGWAKVNHSLAIRGKRMRERRDPIVLPQESSIAQMLAASLPRFADAQEFARETGMREEEIFGLKRSQIGPHAITIYGKGRKLRVIPYTAKAREIVKRQPAYIGSEFVFWHSAGERWKSASSRFTDIRRRVARKAAQTGRSFSEYRFHDLRHLYAVEYLRAAKGSLYDLKELMGHSSVKTTEIYLEHLTPEQKKKAMHGVTQMAARG